MKKFFLALSLLTVIGRSMAQDEGKVRPQPIPNYHILTADSTWAGPANLKKDHPVMIIYFSPDCTHCQRMMYELKPHLKELKSIQIVMVTWSAKYDLRALREFRRDYGLNDYSNIIMGTEGYTMLVQNYYNITSTPYIAFYNSKHQWQTALNKVPTLPQILGTAKKLS